MLAEVCNILMDSFGPFEVRCDIRMPNKPIAKQPQTFGISDSFPDSFSSENLFLCRTYQVSDFSELLTGLFKVKGKIDGLEL